MKAFLVSKYGIIAGVIGMLAVIILGAAVMDRVSAGPKLTIDSAIEQVREHYEGEIVSAAQAGDDYLVRLKTEAGLYEIMVSSGRGGISDIKRIEAYNETTPAPPVDQTMQPAPVEPTQEEPSAKPEDVLIKREHAVAIAIDQIGGTEEETELLNSGSVRYYLVEVDTPDGREAKVQINAASGVIMSIAWDDDDDRDDEDSDDDDLED